MKLIKPYFEIIEQQPGEIGMLKHIEAQGRVAWKSEDRITDDSYIKFLEMLKGVNHGSVLEHGTVYLKYTGYDCDSIPEFFLENKYSKVIQKDMRYYITSNYRVLIEEKVYDLYKNYICEPTEFHEKRVTVRLVIDRGVSHEFVRHRKMSLTQESTRYCNYSKDKFGNDCTFIIPCWFNELEAGICKNIDMFGTPGTFKPELPQLSDYLISLKESEHRYFNLLNQGWKPQQARAVLPNSLKTELIMTGFISDWKHFFHLRTAQGAHPQAQEIAIPLKEEFIKLGLI